jgi:hypothetical protein
MSDLMNDHLLLVSGNYQFIRRQMHQVCGGYKGIGYWRDL